MKTVHLMGIGGTGMVSLAGLFREAGWLVRGSDRKIYPPASTELARMGIEVREGYAAENLQPAPDLVVVGNVITRKNPEAQALLASDLTYQSMAQALAEYFIGRRHSLVVAGTHGKTTTTSLLAHVLESAGKKPGFFVGGVPLNFGQGYQRGEEPYFVLEGDEYDTAFFEKTPKFLHYRARDVLLTSIEFDHADIYDNLTHVRKQFELLLQGMPAAGRVVACGDDPVVREVGDANKDRGVIYYGLANGVHWRAVDIRSTTSGMCFGIEHERKLWAEIDSPLVGEHNVANVLGVVVLASQLGLEKDVVTKAVSTFKGVRRRQEFLGEKNGARVYDDFAHHPTEVAATLAAFRPLADNAGGRLWAVFEPRSNTVRRRVFQKKLPESFAAADLVIIAPVYQKADSLGKEQMLAPSEVAEAICAAGGWPGRRRPKTRSSVFWAKKCSPVTTWSLCPTAILADCRGGFSVRKAPWPISLIVVDESLQPLSDWGPSVPQITWR